MSGLGEADVVVVGAGYAGLEAARRLVDGGAAVVVVEARERVGGRTLTRTLRPGLQLDLGGQWIGPGQQRIAALVRTQGLRPFDQHCDGAKVMALGERVSRYRSEIPSLPLLGLLDLDRAIRRIERLAREVPLDDPARAARAEAWDALTVEQWKRRYVHTRGARALLDVAVRAIFAAEPAELSLLHFLFYLASGGGLMKLSTIRGGAQQTRLAEGLQEPARRLAAGLGERLVLEAPVARIAQTPDGVVVEHARGRVAARLAVVAVPPALAGRIAFDPPLPAARDQLSQRIPMGSVIKCLALYERPFWRAAGDSGEAVSDTGPVALVFDDSPPDAACGALVAFALGRAARELSARSPAERRAVVLGALARFFGPAANEPIDYVDHDWTAERFSGGCYAGLMGPGTWTSLGRALRAPCGRVHWAGTETATAWNGYVEGALESGERVAREVLARL